MSQAPDFYWPPAVLKLAKAIAVAENSPESWNNPGSLTGSDSGSFLTCGTGNAEGVWKFVNEQDGWQALYIKCNRMLSGKSLVYPLTLTLVQVGIRYSGGDPNWSKNVAAFLGVSEQTTLQELADE